MQFATTEDIDVPAAYVFARIIDVSRHERRAMRRGAEVVRRDGRGPVHVGSAWDVAVVHRGKLRELSMEIVGLQAPTRLAFAGRSRLLLGSAEVRLIALSATTTRVKVVSKIKADTLQGRLLLQSLKIARSSLNRRFQAVIAQQLRQLVTNYQRHALSF